MDGDPLHYLIGEEERGGGGGGADWIRLFQEEAYSWVLNHYVVWWLIWPVQNDTESLKNG